MSALGVVGICKTWERIVFRSPHSKDSIVYGGLIFWPETPYVGFGS